jgi:hypothetical protein
VLPGAEVVVVVVVVAAEVLSRQLPPQRILAESMPREEAFASLED